MIGGAFMNWQEVRKLYPHQWLKLKVLENHIDNDKEYIDEMEVIETIKSDIEATRELGKCKENEAVYHTYHEEIYYKLKNIFGYRKVR